MSNVMFRSRAFLTTAAVGLQLMPHRPAVQRLTLFPILFCSFSDYGSDWFATLSNKECTGHPNATTASNRVCLTSVLVLGIQWIMLPMQLQSP